MSCTWVPFRFSGRFVVTVVRAYALTHVLLHRRTAKRPFRLPRLECVFLCRLFLFFFWCCWLLHSLCSLTFILRVQRGWHVWVYATKEFTLPERQEFISFGLHAMRLWCHLIYSKWFYFLSNLFATNKSANKMEKAWSTIVCVRDVDDDRDANTLAHLFLYLFPHSINIRKKIESHVPVEVTQFSAQIVMMRMGKMGVLQLNSLYM